MKLYKQDFVDFLGSQVGENTYEHPYQNLEDLPFQYYFQTPPGYSSREEYIQRKGNDNPQDFVVKVRNERRMVFGKPRQHTRVKLIGRDTGSTAANTKVKPKPEEGLTYPDGYHTKIISGGRPLSKSGVRYKSPKQVVSRMLQGPFNGPLYF